MNFGRRCDRKFPMKIKIECKVASESYDDLNIFRLLFKEVAMSNIDEAFPVRSAFV